MFETNFNRSAADLSASFYNLTKPKDMPTANTSLDNYKSFNKVMQNVSNPSSSVSNGLTYLSYDQISNLLNLLSQQEVNSAQKQMDFQSESNRIAMNFEAQQNLLNRIFQQNSAERAMEFSAKEAEKNRAFQAESTALANEFSAQQVQKQMDFQERMSNTAYQRAVYDLKQAGLNPILAYTQGGASSPSGSSASGVASSGSSASGFSASGSSASGKSSSGSKANISSIASSVLSYSSNIVSNSAKLLSAVGSIIPF